MKSKIAYCLFGIVIGLIIFTILRLFSENREVNGDEIESYVMCNILNSKSFNLPSNLKVLDCKGDEILIDSVLCCEKLVVRFTELGCEECVISQIELLKKIYKEKILEEVVAIVSCENVRLLRLIKEKYNINFPLYFLPYSEGKVVFPEVLESMNTFYTFRGNQKLECFSIFIPSDNFRSIACNYFQTCYNLITKKRQQLEMNPFEETVLNFGTREWSDEHVFEFIYSNKTTAPIILKNVKTTCGCTVAEWDKKPLNPGGSATLRIKLKPESRGVYLKKIFVYFDENPCVLALKGVIK